MEPLTPNSTERTLSPIHGPTAIELEAQKTRQFINEFKKPLDDLTTTFSALHAQTMQVATSGGDVTGNQKLSDLLQQMDAQDHKHKAGLIEIQSEWFSCQILDELLEKKIVEEMRKQVEQEVASQIDELVKEQVEECLKTHIPKDLQDEVAVSKRELEALNLRLHNSESRRANAKLQIDKPGEPLATMFMPNGNVSGRFPKDLTSLFNLDAENTNALMVDYGIPEPSESRDNNLNRFMQFCGVRYQLVE
ncbi:hypothetical protein M413DRAFT_28841 [Hebeloma cylindrosporum]|uniref:Uncharacterized protein n=1 Tax=Hebeloma cylindrosporum TaxID=76867 RepID=A0A0C3BUK8_HEBCY|nr:hypothetical protein M413DRAFT_28841 [Hebeloma cylindrosporum h7]